MAVQKRRKITSPGGGDMTAFTLNGKPVTAKSEADTPLLWVIRDELKLTGTKYGCGIAQCGACTVHVNGEALRSCVVPVREIAGKKVMTLEGLGTPAKPHPVQEAFIAEQAAQCGYCINGMIMQSVVFLKHNPRPTDAQIKKALNGNICRCGTHYRIVRAVERAAKAMA
jgi:aerobic-type carbon monoxide dehydrogenase small subunit (CoxS/CutS family)